MAIESTSESELNNIFYQKVRQTNEGYFSLPKEEWYLIEWPKDKNGTLIVNLLGYNAYIKSEDQQNIYFEPPYLCECCGKYHK